MATQVQLDRMRSSARCDSGFQNSCNHLLCRCNRSILIIKGSGSGKTNALLNLIKEQDNIDKTYLNVKDLSEPKYQFLIEKRKNAGIKHLNDSNAFIKCSNTMNDIYE